MSVISPKRKIDTARRLLFCQANQRIWCKPARGQPTFDRIGSLALGDPERQHGLRSKHGMRKLRLGNNLGGAKRAISSNVRRSKADCGSAASALDFQGICRDRRQLLWSEFEILFVGAFLNLHSGGRDLFTASAVGARKTAITRFKDQVGRTPGTLVAMDLLW